MIIAIFSLGQFISSDLNVLQSGFQRWFEEQEKKITGKEVWDWIVTKLPRLRIADMTLDELCVQFNEHFKETIDFPKFQQIFNSMSALNQITLSRVAQFKNFLEEHDQIKFILVSHTNYSHLEYIMEQLQELLPDVQSSVIGGKNRLSETAQILFAPSMTSKCTGHPDTLKYALEQLKVDDCEHLVSFLNTIKSFEHPKFSYSEAGANLEHVMGILEECNRSHLSIGLC